MTSDGCDPYERIWRGPLKNRNCTDVPCLIIFLLFMLSWFAVGYYAFFVGDINAFLVPTDSRGRKCGVDEGVENKPVLVFFDIKKCIRDKCDTTQVCQSQCPKTNWYFNLNPLSMNETYNAMLCEDGIDVMNKTMKELALLVDSKACASWYLKSTPVLKRCVPQVIQSNLEGINITIDELKKATLVIKLLTSIEGAVNEAILTKNLVFLFMCGGMVVCLLYIILLRWIALPCIWGAIIFVIGLLIFLSYLFYQFYVENDWIGHIVLASISGGVAIIIALIAVCVWKKIHIASQLIIETSKATTHVLSVVFFPVIPWLLELSVITYSIIIALCLMSIEYRQFIVREELSNGNCECSEDVNNAVGSLCEPSVFYKYCHERNGSCFSQSCHLNNVSIPTYKYYLYAFHIVGFTWLYFFISDLKKIIIASSYATWYWTINKADIPFFTLLTSIWRIIKYHLGTVAFGSAIITICRLFRIVLEYLHGISRRQIPPNVFTTQLVNVCFYCSKCFMYLIETVIKFLNRNAYIMCAINGKGLCTAAADALSLMMRNIILAGVLNRVISWLLRMGKIAITSIMILLAWWYFHEYQCEDRREYWYVPTILIAIGSYLVTTIFFSVYTIGVDTIFLCVLQDCEYNDGSREKPYYMNRNLGKLYNIQ